MSKIPSGYRGVRVTGGRTDLDELDSWRRYQEERLQFGFRPNGMRKRDYVAGYRAGKKDTLGDESLKKPAAFAKIHQSLQRQFTELMADKVQVEVELAEARKMIALLLEREE